MKLLVVVETLNGIFIAQSMATAFSEPDPIPSKPDKAPAPNITLNPAGTPYTLYCRIPLVSGNVPFIFNFVASGSGGSSVSVRGRVRRDTNAEYISISPKIIAIALAGIFAVKYAPQSAP